MNARAQQDADAAVVVVPPPPGDPGGNAGGTKTGGAITTVGPKGSSSQTQRQVMRRFHGTVELDPARPGRDASKIAEEVIAHLVGLTGSQVTVTLEIHAFLPDGVSDQTIRTVTENSRTLKFTDHGFEIE